MIRIQALTVWCALSAWCSEAPSRAVIEAAQRQDWPAVITACAADFSREQSHDGFWVLYARAAIEHDDLRLAASLIDGALSRFPANSDVRRLELVYLSRSKQAAPLLRATQEWLRLHADDVEAWSARAWAAANLGDLAGACAALEAIVLMHPDDQQRRRQLAEQLRHQGLSRAALVHYQLLVAQTPLDVDLVVAAATCAGDANNPRLGRTWLNALPGGRQQQLLSARLAVQAGDQAAAVAALDILISNGENDARVLVWAGHLADLRGDLARAEALYSSATTAAKDGSATLQLADLYRRTNRTEQSRQLLERHLAAYPGDAAARTMLEALRQ